MPAFSFAHVPRLAFRVARLCAGAYLLAAGGLYLSQDKLLLVPGAAVAPGQAALAPAGRYLGEVHEPVAPVKGTVVYFHGNAGTAADRSFIAQSIQALGYRVVLVEYPGFGARPGAVDVGVMGRQSLADFDMVRKVYPGSPFFVVGESFGAAMAAAVAGARPTQVCATVLITPWNRLSDLVQEKIPVFPADVLLKARYPSDVALKDYPGSVTIVGAEQDKLIPVHHARTLAQRLPGSRFELIANAGHNDWLSKVSGSDWRRWLSPGCSR